MRKLLLFVLPGILCLLLGGCFDITAVKIVNIESVRILKMDNTGAEMELVVVIKNPNRVGFTIVDSELDASMGDIKLGKAKLKNNIKVGADSEESHKFIVESAFHGSLIGNMASVFMLAQGATEVHLEGKLKARSWGFSKTIPIDIKEKVPAIRF